MKKSSLFFLPFFLISFSFLISCEFETEDEETSELEHSLGWSADDNMDEIPTSTNFGFGNGSLPSSVNLVPSFPPIGDQGNYGTCVAWAVGYNLKTAISGMKQGLSTSQLASPANQASPKDLFTAISNNEKGDNCGGTNFSTALSLLQNRGVATMQTVPYTTLGDCSQSNTQTSWTNEASQHKIEYWRRIEASVTSIKQNLANNIPVVFGARLSDNFMTWNSNSVLSSSSSYNNVGQHAYHAMVIAGYDDNKGAYGAFKIVNSWGNWGDNGYIWVDYNYFINEFCDGGSGEKPLFIASDGTGSVTPPDPNPVVSGVDLASWVFADYTTYNNTQNDWINERQIQFNLYNIGNQRARADSNWSTYYIYFNAYNANDYGVIFYEDFNTSIPANTYNCPTDYNCIFNVDILAGNNFAYTVFGSESATRTYYMPQLTGYYYLVLLADAGDRFEEQDELNNLFYTTNEPKYFDNGYASKGENSNDSSIFQFKNELSLNNVNLKSNKYNTIVTEENRNAYTQKEILEFIKKEYNNGKLKAKAKSSNVNSKVQPYEKK